MRSLTFRALRANFPHDTIRPVQEQAFRKIAESAEKDEGSVLEIPTGEGKTAIGIAALLTASHQHEGPCFYVTPTKNLVDQVSRALGSHAITMFGRSEYPCLYYRLSQKRDVTAEDSPCYSLQCPHRVDPQTLETEGGLEPCPYLLAKYQAKRRAEAGGIVVCTTAFFLVNRLLVSSWAEMEPALVIFDEAHKLAETARGIFEQSVSDHFLRRAAEMVSLVNREQADLLRKFNQAFRRITLKKPAGLPTLLENEELETLIEVLGRINTREITADIKKAVGSGTIDSVADQLELKELERITHGIPRLLNSLGYSLETEKRHPLNYVLAFHRQEEDEDARAEGRPEPPNKANFRLTLKAYYVKSLIQRAAGKNVMAYSATIGDAEIFGHETGLTMPFSNFQSSFPIAHTMIVMPSDTPNLSFQNRSRDDVKNAIKQLLQAARAFAAKGHRSLVVVTSDAERQKLLWFAERDGPKAVSYGNGRTPREAAAAFLAGEGDILVGTASQYATGLDLPAGIAPVIFFLRPGFPQPNDPKTQFERKRFSEGHCWALWKWRVLIEALQVRGRNVRSVSDLGVCFFISQQFRSFLYAGLPDWLKPAYRRDLTLETGVKEALKLLG